MALPSSRSDREYQKFVADSNGNTAIRAIFSGGTLTGDLTITGTLTVQTAINFSALTAGSFTSEGQVIIDVTNAEALLVRKDGDGGDIFIVDTDTPKVSIKGQYE